MGRGRSGPSAMLSDAIRRKIFNRLKVVRCSSCNVDRSTLSAISPEPGRRRGALAVRQMGGVGLFVCLFFLIHVNAVGQISPGPLSKAHTQWNGPAGCVACHE